MTTDNMEFTLADLIYDELKTHQEIGTELEETSIKNVILQGEPHYGRVFVIMKDGRQYRIDINEDNDAQL